MAGIAAKHRVLADPQAKTPDQFIGDGVPVQTISPLGVHPDHNLDLPGYERRGYRGPVLFI